MILTLSVSISEILLLKFMQGIIIFTIYCYKYYNCKVTK